ncbi:glycosyltransferase involved in cell wall biosynthesis [Methylobacterium sp. BE186]|uniref:glycosyltransferase family 4 protein n=1 Tax=Methylobacterium sp. BE186 TaxID=2817715 RepID=UPI0028554A7C|nr:glycosyltransferase family 4 protein [Methylobacterium sp. BE186]MDR7039968.1 glycosyltransferase involved in cell wall biosynthesis [Methylobacterium sp. BE186]
MPVSAGHVLMSADAVGGVWQYGLDLAGGLRSRGYAVTLALMGPAPAPEILAAAEGATGARIVPTGLPLDWTAGTPGAIRDAAAALARLAHEMGADLVHLHSPAFALAEFGRPVVAVCHSCVATWWDACGEGCLPRDLAWRRDLVAEGCRRADRLLAPTRAFAAATQSAYRLPAPPVVVRNGRAAARAISADRAPHAFTAGRLWDRAKNAEALDRVAARLGRPLRAAGPVEGPNGEAARLSHLHLLGRLDDGEIARELAGRPVFVSLARYEPFGLAALEAAAAGCALVLSDIPTFRELWQGAAFFVPPDDDAAAARAIETLVADPARRGDLGRAARVRAGEYGVEAMVEGVLGVVRPLLGAAQARIPGEAAA